MDNRDKHFIIRRERAGIEKLNFPKTRSITNGWRKGPGRRWMRPRPRRRD